MIESYANLSAANPCGPLAGEPPRARAGGARDTDAELMTRLAEEGDRAAFALLVNRYKNPLVAYLARLTGCSERAQDLAQESFLRLFRTAPRYRDRGYFRAYLYRIATNLLRSEERRARLWRRISGLVPSSAEPPAGGADSRLSPDADSASVLASAGSPSWWLGKAEEGAEGRTLRRERQRLLARAIAELPLPYRAVLVLAEIEELPRREVAALLGCREGTVKSRLFRAREKLRQRLEPYWRGSPMIQHATRPSPREESHEHPE